jgi:hypothetical protein
MSSNMVRKSIASCVFFQRLARDDRSIERSLTALPVDLMILRAFPINHSTSTFKITPHITAKRMLPSRITLFSLLASSLKGCAKEVGGGRGVDGPGTFGSLDASGLRSILSFSAPHPEVVEPFEQ